MAARNSSWRRWFDTKWWYHYDNKRELARHYQQTFGTASGKVVMQHLLDSVYCTSYEGTDAIAMAAHSGRRSVIHDILMNLDYAEHPGKYEVKEVSDGSVV